MKVTLTPHARRDLNEIADYIAADSPSSALRFINAAQGTFALLSDNPEAGSTAQLSSKRLAGLRRFRVKGFKNYLIFYLVGTSTLTILRILHGARDIEAIFDQGD